MKNYAPVTARPFQCDKPFVWDPGGPTKILGIDINRDAQLIYHDILLNARNTLNNWIHRGLSLMGKTLIINSLIASLFVYQLQTLEDPSESFFSAFDKMIKDYLWRGKRDKIPLQTLQSEKNQGGIKLVNMRFRNQSLKIAWIFRREEFVLSRFNSFIPESLQGGLFWNCSLRADDVVKCIDVTITDVFWIQIVTHWFKLSWSYENGVIDTSEKVKRQVLWLNSHIRVDRKPLKPYQCANQGMIYMSDVLNSDNKFCQFHVMKEQFDSLTWFQYLQLRAAIPSAWLDTVRENTVQSETCPTLYEKLEQYKKNSTYNIPDVTRDGGQSTDRNVYENL